jgi:hypothetical protein
VAAEDTDKIFLLDLCLWFGSLVIFLDTVDSLARVALLIAVRNAAASSIFSLFNGKVVIDFFVLVFS